VIRLSCVFSMCLMSAGLQAGQSITIASPRGGEFFLVGQTQVVRLDDRTKFKSVGVELSRDGGTTFESLGTIDNAGDKAKRNALSFTVTGPASGNCVVRVRAALGSNQIIAVTGAFVIASPGAGPLQPSGAAGGDLTGTFPNPSIANNVVTAAKVNSGVSSNGFVLQADGSGGANWTALPASPTALPPNGNAGGDLSGTFPNPTVATVGGQSSANVAGGVTLANAATYANTFGAIVKRDGSGNFSAGLIESTSGGFKFPDATTQTTAAIGVPSGFVIMGTSSTAPTGFTSTGQKVETAWVARAPMPTLRHEFGAGAVNGKIYVVGGTSSGGADLVTNEEYDSATNTWSTKAPMPTTRSNHAIGVVNGKVYVVGGKVAGVNYSNTVLEYDPVANTWATKASMPTGRDALGAGVVNGKLYAIGGTTGGNPLDVVEEFDPVGNNWTTKAPMTTGRNNLGIGAANGKIYALCGTSQAASPANVNEEYDPLANTWSTKTPLPVPRNSIAVCDVNGKLYSVGGSSDSNEIQEYDPTSNAWQRRVPMVAGREGHVVAVVNQTIYVIGGYSASILTGMNEEYSPATFYVFSKN